MEQSVTLKGLSRRHNKSVKSIVTLLVKTLVAAIAFGALMSLLISCASVAVTEVPADSIEPSEPDVSTVAQRDPIPAGDWTDDGSTFVNEFFDIAFTLPDGWRDKTAEVLLEQYPRDFDRHNQTEATIGFFLEVGDRDVVLSYYYEEDGAELTPDQVMAEILILGGENFTKQEAVKTDSRALEIAENEYSMTTVHYVNDGYFVDIYGRVKDGIALILQVEYDDGAKTDADAFVAAIRTADYF
jgi:hypothetical protein